MTAPSVSQSSILTTPTWIRWMPLWHGFFYVSLVFATGVVSDWNHQGPNDDAHCPYCHLGHQAPAQLVVAPAVSLLKPIASVALPQDAMKAMGPVFSQTSPRAPPSA